MLLLVLAGGELLGVVVDELSKVVVDVEEGIGEDCAKGVA